MLGSRARTVGVFLLGAGLSFPLHSANAALMQVASRSDLGANLTVDWSVFGPPGTSFSGCPCTAPVGPITVAINSSSSSDLFRRNEGVDYTGNFALGDALLLQSQADERMIIDFGQPGRLNPVGAVGLQIQPLAIGPFIAGMHVVAFDGTSFEFGDFFVSGNSTTAEDNSAPFLGVVSTTNDIVGVSFNFSTDVPVRFPGGSGDVAINQMDVRVVPEPRSAVVLGTALLLLIVPVVKFTKHGRDACEEHCLRLRRSLRFRSKRYHHIRLI